MGASGGGHRSRSPGVRPDLSRGHWRREDPAAPSAAGWQESVTVTWSPVSAPDRRAAVLARALAAAADMITPIPADVAITGIRRLVQQGHRGLLPASVLGRQPVSPRQLPRPDRSP